MQKPLSLVQHLHREVAEPLLNDVFELADRNFFDAFAALLVLNFACKQSPKDLCNQLLVLIGGAKNFLKVVQVLFSF